MDIKSKQIFTLAISAIIMSVLLIPSVFVSGCVNNETPTDNSATNTSIKENPLHAGSAVFAITDEAANIEGISSVNITISKVEINSENKGWIVLSNEEKTYDLLKLKSENAMELLVKSNLSAGSYNQARLHISKVVVIKNGAPIEAKLPSNELKININLKVIENETSTATFDFIADESLHTTGEGKIIMAPVVKVETKTNAKVQINAQNRVEIQGGKVEGDVKVGMNENGDVGVGIKIKENADKGNANLSILGNGKVNIVETLPSIKSITLNKQKYTANEKINIKVNIKSDKNADIGVHIYGITSRQGSNLIDETKNISLTSSAETEVRFSVNAPACTYSHGAEYYPGFYLLNVEIISGGKVIDKAVTNVELY